MMQVCKLKSKCVDYNVSFQFGFGDKITNIYFNINANINFEKKRRKFKKGNV